MYRQEQRKRTIALKLLNGYPEFAQNCLKAMSNRSLLVSLDRLLQEQDPSLDEARHIVKQLLDKTTKQKLRPMSQKRSGQQDEYKKKRRRYLMDFPICERRGCSSGSQEIHHKEKSNGDRYLDESKWMAVCRPCHREITLNPKWAYEEGYLLRVNSVDAQISHPFSWNPQI